MCKACEKAPVALATGAFGVYLAAAMTRVRASMLAQSLSILFSMRTSR